MAVPTTQGALAVEGGRPVRDPARPWPRWPDPPPEAETLVTDVLRGDRWTLSSAITTRPLYERRFARVFASYIGTRHCIPVDHGASALVVALEAVGLEFGDRVLVPTMTWVASATSALRAGLVPVLVDIDPITGSMGPADVDLTCDPKAIVVVHWSCAMADVRAIERAGRGAVIIEDCAQAHGAAWDGRRAGSLGAVGCFSMQQSKVLAAGEGGAVVTDDAVIAERLEELRADGRRPRMTPGAPGQYDLIETGGILGSNYSMSEFSAALLCAQLTVLQAQHARRSANFEILATLLEAVPGVRLVRPHPAQTASSIYEIAIVFEPLPRGFRIDDVARALSAELGRPMYRPDTPLHRSRLFRPETKRTLGPLAQDCLAVNRGRWFPVADHLYDHAVVTHHSALLGDEGDMTDIARAVTKIAAAAR